LLLIFLLHSDIHAIFTSLLSFQIFILITAIIIYFASLFINSIKWKRLLNTQNLISLIKLTFISQYYTIILPGQLAGEGIKAYKLGKGKKDAERIAASVIVDRITGFLGLLAVGLVGALLSNDLNSDFILIILSTILFVFVLLLFSLRFRLLQTFYDMIIDFFYLRFNKVRSIFDRLIIFKREWIVYLNKPMLLLESVGIGFIFQVLAVLVTYILSIGLNLDINFLDLCWVFSFVSVLMILPITVAGIGLREGGFVSLLGLIGILPEKALALSLSLFGIQLLGAAIGGIIEFSKIKIK